MTSLSEHATSSVGHDDATVLGVGDAIMWREERQTEDGEFEFNFKYGAVMEQRSSQHDVCLPVHELKQNQDNKLWAFSDTFWLDVPFALIQKQYSIHNDDGNAPKAWDNMGFRMVDGGTLVKHSDEVGSNLFPVGDAAFEVVSDSDDSEGSLKDFVVPDGKCSPFTFAEGTYAQETHAAVRAFDNWQPKDDQEARTKAFIVKQEKRAMQLDDNARFARGLGALNYNRPDD